MDVSDLTRERISREYEHHDRRERVEAAADRASIHDEAVVKAAEKRIVKVLKDNGGRMSGGSLRNALSRPQREVSDQAVDNLLQAHALKIKEMKAEGNKRPWRVFILTAAGPGR